MNWIIFFKSLSVIVTLTILMSVVFTGMWIFLRQQKENPSVISTPASNITDYKDIKNDFNIMVLNNKSEDYKNIRGKSNGRNITYEVEINSTWRKYDGQTKHEYSNYNIKNKNSNSKVKPVLMKNNTKINVKIQDQIGGTEIKEEMIPKVKNSNIFNDKSVNNIVENLKFGKTAIADNNNRQKVSEINSSPKNATIIAENRDSFHAWRLIKLLNNDSDNGKKNIDRPDTESLQQISSKVNINKEDIMETINIDVTTESSANDSNNSKAIMNNLITHSTEKKILLEMTTIRSQIDDNYLDIQTKDIPSASTTLENTEETTTEEIHSEFGATENNWSPVSDSKTIEMDTNKSKINNVKATAQSDYTSISTICEEVIHESTDDDVITTEKTKLLDSDNTITKETNLDTQNEEGDLLLAASTIAEITKLPDSDDIAIKSSGISSSEQNLPLALNTSGELMIDKTQNNSISAKKSVFSTNRSNSTEKSSNSLGIDSYNVDLRTASNNDAIMTIEKTSNDNETTENVEFLLNTDNKSVALNLKTSKAYDEEKYKPLASNIKEETSTENILTNFDSSESIFENSNNNKQNLSLELNSEGTVVIDKIYSDSRTPEIIELFTENISNVESKINNSNVDSNKQNLFSGLNIERVTIIEKVNDDNLTSEETRLIQDHDETNFTTLNPDSLKPTIPFTVTISEEIGTEKSYTEINMKEQTSLLLNGGSSPVSSDSTWLNISPASIVEDETNPLKTYSDFTTEKITLTNNNGITEKSIERSISSTPISTTREETTINMTQNDTTIAQITDLPNISTSDTFNSTQTLKYELSHSSSLIISIETETHEKKSENSILRTSIDEFKVSPNNKTQNNGNLKTLEISNSTFNLTKDNESKDVIIVTPTTIDSEVINSCKNQSKKVVTGPSYSIDDSTLYFNNGSDQVIIITPTIVDGDNIFNNSHDQSTGTGIKSTFDSNLENLTSSNGNELISPEISSSTIDDSSFYFDDKINDDTNVNIQGEDNRKCYGELGCLSISPSWYHPLNRRRNILPLPRETINTSVIIYTRDDPVKGQVIIVSKIKSVERINLNPKRKTKFIIHGFNSSPQVTWVKEMRNELLQQDDFNVIVVDWTGGSSLTLFYTQAAGNTRLVGLEIAYLIKHLHVKYGLRLDDVHLIGHSLGAHIAGYAGEKMRGKIERISGLDPAMPDFEKMPSHVRLDFTDAKFVDVIHTDSERIVRLGIYQPCGHLDFYPNNGDDQPGCSESFFGKVCDHTRAIKLFTESINSKCKFIAHECLDYKNFIAGKCFLCNSSNSLNCGIMGYHADKSPALPHKLIAKESVLNSVHTPKFFISTGDKYPYCRQHYRITIDLARPKHAKLWLQGFINVTLQADNGVINNMELTPNGNRIKLSHGSTTQIVVVPPEDAEYSIGKIRKVELFWIYNSNELLYRCFFCNDELYVDNIVVDILELLSERKKREMDFSSKLCSIQGPQKYTRIMSGSSAPFVDNCYSQD